MPEALPIDQSAQPVPPLKEKEMSASGPKFESGFQLVPLRTLEARHWTATLRAAIPACAAALVAACGGGGSSNSIVNGPCGAPSCTPSITVSAPSAGATVKGTVALTAAPVAAGTYTVQSVQFLVDGTAVGAAVTAAPYTYNLDSTTIADGAHQISAQITDSATQNVTSPSINVTVANTVAFALTLDPKQLFPVPASTATATGSLTFNAINGLVSGNLTVAGTTATAVEMGDAYAGDSSAALIVLAADATTAGQWNIPAATNLNAQQLADLQAGKLYVLVRSAAYPAGELRAQILPTNVSVRIATLSGTNEVPPVLSGGQGQAAVTVDSTAMTAAVHVTVSGITPTDAELDTGGAGAVGTTLATLTVDPVNPNHYSDEGIALLTSDLTNFNSDNWYVNVSTAAHASGELRGAVSGPPVTLTQLQSSIFTPICSSCHAPGGDSPDLTSSNSYANIVNVASTEQPSLLRIKPGDPDHSYLVLKVQGSAGISGVRMPAVGTALTQVQIDAIRSWVTAGALNN
jgi:hypothetical protein